MCNGNDPVKTIRKSPSIPSISAARTSLIAVVIFFAAHFLLLVGVTTPDKFVFDEVHYVPAARQMLERILQAANFGELQGIPLRDGDPIFDDTSLVILDAKLDKERSHGRNSIWLTFCWERRCCVCCPASMNSRTGRSSVSKCARESRGGSSLNYGSLLALRNAIAKPQQCA